MAVPVALLLALAVAIFAEPRSVTQKGEAAGPLGQQSEPSDSESTNVTFGEIDPRKQHPERIPVADAQGELTGYVDRDALYPSAEDGLSNDAVSVTDSDGTLVGYLVPGHGYVDRDTWEDPARREGFLDSTSGKYGTLNGDSTTTSVSAED